MANSRINRGEADILRQARSVIRDLAYGYPPKELVQTPERMCEQLSHILQEQYDFEKGDVVEPSEEAEACSECGASSGECASSCGQYQGLRNQDI